MRKLILALLVAVIACAALFAFDETYWTVGLFQSAAATSVTGSFNFDNFEVEAGLGLPVLSVLGFGNGNVYTDEAPSRPSAVIRHPVISLSATYAVITMDADDFDAFMRIGLTTDMTLSCSRDFRLVGSYGIATSMDIDFDTFRFGVQVSIPASNLMGLAGLSPRRGYYVIGSWDDFADTLASVSYNTGSVRIFGKYIFY